MTDKTEPRVLTDEEIVYWDEALHRPGAAHMPDHIQRRALRTIAQRDDEIARLRANLRHSEKNEDALIADLARVQAEAATLLDAVITAQVALDHQTGGTYIATLDIGQEARAAWQKCYDVRASTAAGADLLKAKHNAESERDARGEILDRIREALGHDEHTMWSDSVGAVDALLEEKESAERDLAEVVAMLRRVEWFDHHGHTDNYSVCPVCTWDYPDHGEGCALAALLDKHKDL